MLTDLYKLKIDRSLIMRLLNAKKIHT